jgi:predicted nucleic-acid-binding protein
MLSAGKSLMSEDNRMSDEQIFVDTNLFLRYLTNDIPAQADAVEKVLRRSATGEFSLITNTLVIAEIIWTLESFYKLDRVRIKEMVLSILNTPGLEVAESNLILTAIFDYTDKNVDFIDAFNAAWAMDQGIIKVYTFDRKHFNRLGSITSYVPGQA